ncbi:MAG: sensor histidine kinase [Longimicrobiales bacterium]
MRRDPFPLKLLGRSRRRLPATTWLVAFLVATVGLSLWLAYQAQDAARSHREAAESAVRDYARIAAWQYGRLATEELDEFFEEVFDEVPHRMRREMPDPEEIWRDVDDGLRRADCDCPRLADPPLVFRLDLRTLEMDAIPETVSGQVLARIADTLRVAAAVDDPPDHGLLVTPGQFILPEATALAYALTADADGTAMAYGVVFDAVEFGALFSGWYERARLLPPAITGAAPNDSLLHVAVRASSGVTLFESPVGYSDELVGADTLTSGNGLLIVQASIRPDAVSRLIIGGLPTSRLPLILGLLLITLGVGGAALFQIRRERQLARLRDDFISGVSHELRTPLAQIRMFAELQEAGKLRTLEERQRAVSVINREAQRLTHLVENILRFSRLRRTSERRSAHEAIDVASTVGDIVEAFRPLAGARRMAIHAEIEPGLRLLANRDALNQVLVNLLDNAVKYGPSGQTILIQGRRTDGRPEGMASIAVQDAGPGVPAADRGRIWEPYLRLERELDARLPGTGIGLAVVAQLVQMNGGRAHVEDAPGGGARFVVELPAAAMAGAPVEPVMRREVPA